MTHFRTTQLTIPTRFRGPATSGNGGWSAGALAGCVDHSGDRGDAWPAIEVTLRMPPPLETPLAVTHDDGTTRLTLGDAVVAEARQVDTAVAVVEPVSADEAGTAMASYGGLVEHPFPECFACGTARAEGDGLHIFPGRVGGPEADDYRVATLWTPHESLREDFHEYVDDVPRASLAVTWAALDCPGGWTAQATDRPSVLGRMTAEVDALPAIGERHVVVGQRLGVDGRKTHTASTLYDADGRVVARAQHTWVAVAPGFGG